MKAASHNRNLQLALHLLLWSILLLLPYIVSNATHQYSIGLLPGTFFTLAGVIHLLIFYGNALLLYPRLLNRRYWWLYLLSALLLIVGSFQLKYYILLHWYPEVLKNTASYKFVFAPSIVVFIVSIVYCRVMDKIRSDREQKETQTEQLMTELKFLRSQVSPHFLFNVLTNLVSLARKKSDKLEQSLIMLSDLMRYMLYDTQGKRVALAREVAYLENYIALQRLRFGQDIAIQCQLNLQEEDSRLLIEPMLLIPFVENAFKHGSTAVRPMIDIHLKVEHQVLLFEVKNTFDPAAGSKEEHSGIGISNVQTRLNLLYQEKHTLHITQRDDEFHVSLTLRL